MEQLQSPSLGQESIHETVRILVPGYFAVFLVFTLRPEWFGEQRGIALVLAGGVGLGLALYGMNLHGVLGFLKLKFGKTVYDHEVEKLSLLMKILRQLSDRKADNTTKLSCNHAIEDLAQRDLNREELKHKERVHFSFLYYLWDNFSYSEINDAVRARQRIHASLFYLYSNCTMIMIGYAVIVLLPYIVSILNMVVPLNLNAVIPISVTLYKTDLDVDVIRVVISTVLVYAFWRKGNEELKKSMQFQKSSIYFFHEKLYEKLADPLNLYYEGRTKHTKDRGGH
jgi:hypothetical protein